MNGIHDMGGMHGMGPIEYETDEPVFHAPWEGRAYAITRLMAAWRKWNLDTTRHSRELIPPAEYLRSSYYEKWIAGLIELMVQHGLVTPTEVETGKAAEGSRKATPPLTAGMVAAMIAKGGPTARDIPVPARFKPDDRVRVRNIHPTGHTRAPRYTRGKSGIVSRDHGVFVFPDTNAHFLGEKPQHVY